MLLLQMFPAAPALVAIFAIFDTIGQQVPWFAIETHGAVIVAYLGGVATHLDDQGLFRHHSEGEENAKG